MKTEVFNITHVISGAVSAAAGTLRYSVPGGATILGATARITTAPAGSSMIIDINKSGTTIYTTQANRLTIADAANVSTAVSATGTSAPASAGENQAHEVLTLADTDYVTFDVDQVGSGTAGSNLVITLRCKRLA